MRIHFFAAPFWLLSFGSGFKVQGSGVRWRLRRNYIWGDCTCQQKLDTKLKKLGIKIEYLYKIQ